MPTRLRPAIVRKQVARPASGDPHERGDIVADKSPKKPSSKKPGKSLKEKRAEKQAKKNEKRPSGM